MNEWILSGFCFSSLMFGISALLLFAKYKYSWKSDFVSLIVWLMSYSAAFMITKMITDVSLVALITPILLHLLLVGGLIKLKKIASLFGVFFLVSLFTPFLYGFIWFCQLIYKASYYLEGWPLIALWFVGIILGGLMITNTVMWSLIVLNRFSELYYHFPRRKKGWEIADQAQETPFVSIHIPCYAEPPEIVIETLRSLSHLEYSNYEVIVLDNNTKDLSLWKPIEEYCTKLGKHFRFFHIEQLKGAKAGALNEALRLTNPQAEIISVIDADFVTKPDFLKRLVGFFSDPKVGFVQTCQDYRDWRSSRFLSSCYFEYETHFKLEMPGQNEADVNYTIGTMCLIRKKALEDAGGWAEWCLTEDSEIAVRIHDLGYSGYYLKDSFGFGLIPETFEAYKQQRFRWTAGPSQQIQNHWRLYLPWSSSGLTFSQKVGEIFHSLATFFNESQNLLLNIPFLIICLWLVFTKQYSLVLPPIFLLFIVIAICRNMLCNWIKIRLLGGTFGDSFFSSLAARSLVYTRNAAFCKAWFSHRLAWKRTIKFNSMKPSIKRAFLSSKTELAWSFIYLIVIIGISPFANFKHPDIIFLIWLGLLNQMISLLCAPVMALLAEKDIYLRISKKI